MKRLSASKSKCTPLLLNLSSAQKQAKKDFKKMLQKNRLPTLDSEIEDYDEFYGSDSPAHQK